MKKIKLISIIVSVILILSGAIIAGAVLLTTNIKELNTVKVKECNYIIENKEFSNISVRGAECDVNIVEAADGVLKVECQEGDDIFHIVEVENDTLNIVRHDNRKWYQHFGIYWGDMKITIHLPKKEYNNLKIVTLSGDINVTDKFSFKDADIKVTSGDLKFASQVYGKLNVKSTSGDVKITGVEGKEIVAKNTSGEIEISDCKLEGKLEINTTSGDVKLKNVIVKEQVNMESSSADIKLSLCDAESIRIKSVSGDVEGSLLNEKIFKVKTTSGHIDIPSSATGGMCEVKTSSGDVKFRIIKEN